MKTLQRGFFDPLTAAIILAIGLGGAAALISTSDVTEAQPAQIEQVSYDPAAAADDDGKTFDEWIDG